MSEWATIDPPDVELHVAAWLRPGESLRYVARYNKHLVLFGYMMAPLVVVGFAAMTLLRTMWPLIALLPALLVLSLTMRSFNYRFSCVVVTNHRVLVVRAMGPEYVEFADLAPIAVTSTVPGGLLGYATLALGNGVRIVGVKRAAALVTEMQEAASQAAQQALQPAAPKVGIES